jgi:hypothetical protein
MTPTTEHPAVSRRRGGSGEPSLLRFSALDPDGLFIHPGRRRPTQCRACRAPRLCRLANLFAAAHTRALRLDHSTTWPVKTLPLCDPTRLPSRECISRPTSCDACRARGGARSVPRASSLGSGGFAATRPRATPLHRYDPVLVFPNTAVSVRPPFTPAYRIDGGRFSGPDAASRLLQRVFKLRRTSTCPRAWPSPTAGGCPVDVAVHDALFTLPAPSSLNAKTNRARCTAASYAFSPTPGLETRTPKAVTFAPVNDTFRWVHETWETRRPEERSEGEPPSLAGLCGPDEACAPRSLLDCSSEPLLSPAMRARRDGGPFACWYTSASPAEASVPIAVPRRTTPFRRPRGFSPWESSNGRDRSLDARQALSATQP